MTVNLPEPIATNQAHFNRIVGNATGARLQRQLNRRLTSRTTGGVATLVQAPVALGCTGTPNGRRWHGRCQSRWQSVDRTDYQRFAESDHAGRDFDRDGGHDANSARATLTPPPSVPPVGVTFSATNGNVSPTAGTITSGQANTTFTSTSTSAGTACSTVDGQEALHDNQHSIAAVQYQ